MGTGHYDVKFRAIAFTTMKKSVQALKFQFDWPIPNVLGSDFTKSFGSSVDSIKRNQKIIKFFFLPIARYY